MATIKKNQLANIIFPMVDKVDFATIESGITASDFNSAAIKKFFGVTHGNSTAFTSGTISKATSLVRSGIFQQTLKATETNYDYLLVRFTHPSCADQLLIFHPVDFDDSDLMSRLSDVGSDLLSYLTGMSGMLSDVYSNLSDFKSDFQSRVPKLVATNSQLSDIHSDLLSYLVGISGLLSDVDSQLNLVPISISASDMSDIVSRVWSAKYTAHSLASSFGSLFSDVYSRIVFIQSLTSDIDSQLLLNASIISDVYSLVSDLQSDFQSRVPKRVATDSQLSDVHSDLQSRIAGITASVSASDISDIASAVWAAKYTANSLASSFGSLISDIFSRVALTQSNVSDIQSALDSQFVWESNFLSDIHSDLRSYLIGLSGLLSDVESQVDLLATSNYLSQIHSDLSSKIGGITATLDASDISDIGSAVWANAIGTRVDSRIALIQSNVSDIESQLDLTASVTSDIYSLLSDFNSDFQSRVNKQVANYSQLSNIDSNLLSYLVGLSNLLSDIESQVDLVSTSNYLSQVHSDLSSKIGNVSVVLTNSNISDIASAVTAEIGSTISDIYSLLQTFPVFSTAPERTYTIVESNGTPIQGVHVDISTDSAGANVVWSGDTDTFGILRDNFDNKPRLEAGTYYFWRSRVGYSFDNPDSEVFV